MGHVQARLDRSVSLQISKSSTVIYYYKLMKVQMSWLLRLDAHRDENRMYGLYLTVSYAS